MPIPAVNIGGNVEVCYDEVGQVSCVYTGPASTGGGGGTTLPAFAYETEAQAYFTAHDAAGAAMSAKHKYTVNRLFKRAKAAGLPISSMWFTDSYYPPSEAQMRINMFNPSQVATKVGTPTYTSLTGASASANGSYYDTGVSPTTLGQNSAHIAVYSNTATVSANYDAGSVDGSGNGLAIAAQTATGAMTAMVMGPAATTTATSAGTFTGDGHSMAVRSVSTGFDACKYGPVQEVIASTSAALSSPPTLTFLTANGTGLRSVRVLRGYSHGPALTADQEELWGAMMTEYFEMAAQGEPILVDAGVDMTAQYGATIGGSTVALDLAVYGDDHSGLVAAYSAIRFNPSLKVAIIMPEDRSTAWSLGGILSQGLGCIDTQYTTLSGNKYISGIWYDMIRYGSNVLNNTRGISYPVTNANASLEPKQWNQIARHMLDSRQTAFAFLPGRDVPVYFTGSGISSYAKTGTRVTGFTTADGRVFTCRVFLSADYWGDALPALGIPYVIGREAAGTGMESQNGYQLPSNRPKFGAASSGQSGSYQARIDPYVTPGTPASGLLPDVIANPGLTVGQADPTLQGINHRFFLTKNVKRKAPFFRKGAPAGYSAARYERQFRGFQVATTAGTTPTFFDLFNNNSVNANSGFDFNNGGDSMGSDLPQSGDKAAAADTLTKRRALTADLAAYREGYFYSIAAGVDARIPAAVTTTLNTYWPDSTAYTDPEPGGLLWKPDLPYWRDTRCMMQNTGAVLNGNDCAATDGTTPRISTNILSCCSYAFDYHPGRNIAYNDGTSTVIYSQGGGFTGSSGGTDALTPLPREVFVPDASVLTNFLTTTAPSMTKVAWSTYRLQPAQGVVGQCLGIWAAMAIASDQDLLAVDHPTLAANIQAAPDTTHVFVQTVN